MRILDPKFVHNARPYVLQCIFATLLIFAMLFLIDSISSMTIVASLGASAFIAFTMPHANVSRPRYLIGGYVIGAFSGIAMHFFYHMLLEMDIQILGHSPHILACALAVGFAIFLMTITNFEHPPAAALAMGLVIEKKLFITAGVAIFTIILVAFIKTLIKKWLHNLL